MPRIRNNEEKTDKSKGSLIKSYIPIFISVIAVLISITGDESVHDWIYSGSIDLQPPVGYAILKQIVNYPQPNETEYSVILPIDLINTFKSTVVIMSDIKLHLFVGNKSDELLLLGLRPPINSGSFSGDYTVTHSLILKPNSISSNVLVFEFNNSSNYLDSGKEINASIAYKMREIGDRYKIISNEVWLFTMQGLDYLPNKRDLSSDKNYWYFRDFRRQKNLNDSSRTDYYSQRFDGPQERIEKRSKHFR